MNLIDNESDKKGRVTTLMQRLPHSVAKPPLIFRLAKHMIRRNIRGGYRLMHAAALMGALDCLVRYPLGSVSLSVPIWRLENQWDLHDVMAYERDLVELVASRVRRPSVLIDCGAEIGTFSVALFARALLVTRVIAIEPNERCIGVLRTNMEGLPISTSVIHAAVGSEAGWGSLCSADEYPLEYAMYVRPSADGNTRIVPIDELDLPADMPVVLKLDVEGAEAAAIKGALKTLATREFVLTVEANGAVFHRTKEDPCEILRLVPQVRECEIAVAEVSGRPVDLGRPFLEQFPEMLKKTLNVVVSTR